MNYHGSTGTQRKLIHQEISEQSFDVPVPARAAVSSEENSFLRAAVSPG